MRTAFTCAINCGQCTLTRSHHTPEGIINTFVLPLEELGTSFNGTIHRLQVEYSVTGGPIPNLNPK